MYALFKVNYVRPLIFLCSQTACNTVALPRRDCNSALRRRRLFENCNENSKQKYYLARGKRRRWCSSPFSRGCCIRAFGRSLVLKAFFSFVVSSLKKNMPTVVLAFVGKPFRPGSSCSTRESSSSRVSSHLRFRGENHRRVRRARRKKKKENLHIGQAEFIARVGLSANNVLFSSSEYGYFEVGSLAQLEIPRLICLLESLNGNAEPG